MTNYQFPWDTAPFKPWRAVILFILNVAVASIACAALYVLA